MLGRQRLWHYYSDVSRLCNTQVHSRRDSWNPWMKLSATPSAAGVP